MGAGRAETIVEEVRKVVAQWPDFAEQAGVIKEWRSQIQGHLRLNLPRE